MGYYSNKRNIRLAKVAAGQMQAASIRGMEAVSAQQARNITSEQAKFNVLGLLGTEGTYGPDAPGGGSFENIMNTTNTGYGQVDQNLRAYADWGGFKQLDTPRLGVIDPDKYASAISKTPLFQIQSQQVAEAKQLVDREGPLWDRLSNSILGTIHEGAALQLRDTLRQLKNNYAKGGTARRASVNEFNTILAQERAMRTRVQETWKANLQLHDFVNQNVDRVIAGSQRFVDNLPGLNESYRNAMQETAKLAVFSAESAAQIAGQAYDLRMSQQAVDYWTNLAEGATEVVISVVSSYVGGAVGGAFAPGTGALGGGISAGPAYGAAAGAGGGGALGVAAGNLITGLGGAAGAAGSRQAQYAPKEKTYLGEMAGAFTSEGNLAISGFGKMATGLFGTDPRAQGPSVYTPDYDAAKQAGDSRALFGR